MKKNGPKEVAQPWCPVLDLQISVNPQLVLGFS